MGLIIMVKFSLNTVFYPPPPHKLLKYEKIILDSISRQRHDWIGLVVLVGCCGDCSFDFMCVFARQEKVGPSPCHRGQTDGRGRGIVVSPGA